MVLETWISQLIRLLRYAKRMYIAVSHPVFLVNCELGCEQGRIVDTYCYCNRVPLYATFFGFRLI